MGDKHELIPGYNSGIEDPKYHIAVFNGIFNPKVQLPPGVSIDGRDVLKKDLLVDRFFLRAQDHFLGKRERAQQVDPRDAELLGKKLLTYSELVRRVDRNHLKMQRDDTVSHTLRSVDTGASSTMSNNLTKETTSPYVPHLGKWKAEIKDLTVGQKTELPSAIRLFINEGEIRVGHCTPKQVLDLTQLTVAETMRNRTTAFMAPIFWEAIEKRPTAITHNSFPIAMEHAQEAMREITSLPLYAAKLPHGQKYDLKQAKEAEYSPLLLAKEGELLIDWLDSKGCREMYEMQSSAAFCKDSRGAIANIEAGYVVQAEVNTMMEKFARKNLNMTPVRAEYDRLAASSDATPARLEDLQAVVGYVKDKANITEDKVRGAVVKGIEVLNENIVKGWYGIDVERSFNTKEYQLKKAPLAAGRLAVADHKPSDRRADPGQGHDQQRDGIFG